MRNDNGVDPFQWYARRVHAAPERLPRLLARKTWIDECKALVILEGVGVDVA